jgi:hypothetical protein
MNMVGSIPVGVPLTIINTSANSFALADDRTNAIFTVPPYQAVSVVNFGLSMQAGQPRPNFSFFGASAYGTSPFGLNGLALAGMPGSAGEIGQMQAKLAYSPILGGWASNVDLNVGATDTPITITSPVGNYVVNAVIVRNHGTTASLTTATLGLFTGAGGTGVAISADQPLAGITSNVVNTAANGAVLTISSGVGAWFNSTTLYARVGTPQGASATADVYVLIRPLP